MEIKEENIKISEALLDLEEGYVLAAYFQGRPSYFLMKKGEIRIQSDNLLAPISKEDFLTLYKDTLFSLVPDDEPLEDPEKDREYYSWKREM